MKLIDGMILTKLDDDFVAVSSGEAERFHGIVKLNKTGADIWNLIEEGLDESAIAAKLVEKYDGVDYDNALKNTKYVIDVLKDKGILIDE